MASPSSRQFPRLGDIYEVALGSVIGSEIAGRRPALVVSNDLNNRYSSTVTVLPITSQRSNRTYPFEVLLQQGIGGLTADSRAKANQIRTIDKQRLVSYRGHLPQEYLPLVSAAIKAHLALR